jgi:phosphoglycolate phosphatase-like HAD superfamily hydrolase
LSNRGLLIFDLDGTLFRTETAIVPAVRGAFEKFGLPRPQAEEVTGLIGAPYGGFYAWLEQRAAPGMMHRLADEIGRRELALVVEEGQLYPGVREVLQRMRSAMAQMALCSNGPEVYVRTVVDGHGITDFFDAVRWRTEGDVGKAQMVGDLLERLDARPAVVVGDHRDDIDAARENHICAIGATYGYGAVGEIDGADALIDAVDQLPDAISKLLRGR